MRLRGARVAPVSAHECSELSVRVLWCVVTRSFFAERLGLRVPRRSTAIATPQPQGSTRSHRRKVHVGPSSTTCGR